MRVSDGVCAYGQVERDADGSWRMLKNSHILLRYGVAVAVDVLALLLTLLIWQLIAPTITPLFFVAVMIAAWYGGLGPGLLATVLAAFASAYFFIPPLYSLVGIGWDDLVRLGVFTLVTLLANSLTVARRHAEEDLRKAHGELEKRVQERTAELQRLSAELRRAQENERRRIARDLHDGVAQILSGLFMHLDLLEPLVADVHAARERLSRVRSLAEQSLDEVRGLVWALRPTVLDDLGLPDALRGLVTNLARNIHIDIALSVDRELPALPPPTATALYRISQEALSNVVQHAGASQAQVHLGVENGSVRLTIADDGCGFDMATPLPGSLDGRGMGLWSMRERAEEIGGTFTLRATPGQGTTIIVTT